MNSFPIPVHTLVKTIDELLTHLGEKEVADLIRQAEPTIENSGSDDWNRGTDFYTLNLHIPVAAFAAIDARREQIEELILQKAQLVAREFDSDVITHVLIVPDTNVTRTSVAWLLSPAILKRIWEGDGLRLFLTHRAEDKIPATTLKKQLATFGVAAFVAHEDIEPTQEWQSEIESGLASMHALAALITPGIASSVWCQQEIGFALGAGIPVLPLRLGADPHGFIGRLQALSGRIDNMIELSAKVLDLLIANPRTSPIMRESILGVFENASSWEDARLLSSKIVTITRFDEKQLDRLERTLTANLKVAEAWGVPSAIKQLIAKQRLLL